MSAQSAVPAASAWRTGRICDRFAGRVALVTGAGGAGIGPAVAQHLASEDASIVALESHASRTTAVVDLLAELSSLGRVDYAAAEALGAKAYRVDSVEDFGQAFALATSSEGPTIIKVRSSPSASPTLRVRDLLRATRAPDRATRAPDGATGDAGGSPSQQSAYFG